jgi:hypothetical protein
MTLLFRLYLKINAHRRKGDEAESKQKQKARFRDLHAVVSNVKGVLGPCTWRGIIRVVPWLLVVQHLDSVNDFVPLFSIAIVGRIEYGRVSARPILIWRRVCRVSLGKICDYCFCIIRI